MRQVYGLSGLLAVALIGSYLTWTDDGKDDIPEGAVPVYAAAADSVSKVSWTSDSVDVVVEQKSDDKGEYYTVEVTERKEKRPPPKPPEPPEEGEDKGHNGDAAGDEAEDGEDAAEEEEEAPPEIETTVTSFVGHDAAEKLFESMEPLLAVRSLTLPDGKSSDDFGFDEPTATIEVTADGSARKLVLGTETFGSKDHIVDHDGSYFLVEAQTLRPLQFGKTRLLERALHPFDEKELTSVVVAQGPQSITLAQQHADDSTKAFWSEADDPDTEHPSAGAWLSKVLRMRAKTQVQDADLPPDLGPAFELTLTDGTDTWTVQVLKTPAFEKRAWAEVDYLRGHVELTASLANDAMLDINNLFAPE